MTTRTGEIYRVFRSGNKFKNSGSYLSPGKILRYPKQVQTTFNFEHNYGSNKTFNFHLILRRYSEREFSAGIYKTNNLGLETKKHSITKSSIKSIVELGYKPDNIDLETKKYLISKINIESIGELGARRFKT